jgi:hypothetical protein
MPRPRVFQIPAILEGVSPLKDGGLSLRFHTNEVKEAKDKTKVMNFFNTFGWLQFSDNSIHVVPAESAHRESGVKTPSQRLRGVLFVLWQQKYADEPFDVWYEKQMERIINRIKEELR